MLKYGSEVAKEFNHLHLLDPDVSEAHKNGDIHIHDLDFYALTETCAARDTRIVLKVGNRVFPTTFAFFDSFFNTKEKQRVDIHNVEILSSDGTFVPVQNCERRLINTDEKMYSIDTDYNKIKLTERHYVPIHRNGQQMLLMVKELQVGDELIRGSKYEGHLNEINLIDVITKDEDVRIENSSYLYDIARHCNLSKKLYAILDDNMIENRLLTLAEYKRVRTVFTGLVHEYDLKLKLKSVLGTDVVIDAVVPLTKKFGEIVGYYYTDKVNSDNSRDLHLIDWIYDANPDFVNGFLSTLIRNSGKVSENLDFILYYTDSRTFRDAVQHLMLINGYDTKVEYWEESGKYLLECRDVKALMRLDCFKEKCASEDTKESADTTTHYHSIRKIYDVPYNDFVYDIETGNHYFNANGYLIHNCLQLPLDKLFNGGFNTGHGYLREPGSIRSYASLTAIALQSNQNEMHGGQSIPALDYYLAPGIGKSYVNYISEVLQDKYDISDDERKDIKAELKGVLKEHNFHLFNDVGKSAIYEVLEKRQIDGRTLTREEIDKVLEKAYKHTDNETYQAMEALVHNLNSMHSRAGAQVSKVA